MFRSSPSNCSLACHWKTFHSNTCCLSGSVWWHLVFDRNDWKLFDPEDSTCARSVRACPHVCCQVYSSTSLHSVKCQSVGQSVAVTSRDRRTITLGPLPWIGVMTLFLRSKWLKAYWSRGLHMGTFNQSVSTSLPEWVQVQVLTNQLPREPTSRLVPCAALHPYQQWCASAHILLRPPPNHTFNPCSHTRHLPLRYCPQERHSTLFLTQESWCHSSTSPLMKSNRLFPVLGESERLATNLNIRQHPSQRWWLQRFRIGPLHRWRLFPARNESRQCSPASHETSPVVVVRWRRRCILEVSLRSPVQALM